MIGRSQEHARSSTPEARLCTPKPWQHARQRPRRPPAVEVCQARRTCCGVPVWTGEEVCPFNLCRANHVPLSVMLKLAFAMADTWVVLARHAIRTPARLAQGTYTWCAYTGLSERMMTRDICL